MRSVFPAMMFVAVLLLGACGVKEDTFYDDFEKTYGAGTDDAQSGDQTAKKPGSKPGPSQGPIDDEEPTEPDVVPPETLTLHNDYQSKYDYDTIYRLLDNYDPAIPGSIVKNTIISEMPISALDGMIMTSTYGDGSTWNMGQQVIVNTAGDAKGAPTKSESGTQEYFRVTGSEVGDCPNIMVCIKHLVWTPNLGSTYKFCYSDPAAAAYKAVPLPYAFPPNYSGSDFAALDGVNLGTYTVSKYAGTDVDCDDPTGHTPLTQVDMVVTSRYATQAELDGLSTPAGARSIDFGMVLENTLTRNVGQSEVNRPYIDELTKIQRRAEFYFNEADRIMVKLIKNVRTETGKSWPLPNGVQVNVEFDLCQDKLDADETPVCVRE